MNRKSVKWLLVAVFSAGVLGSAVGWTMGPGGGMRHDPAHMVEHMTDMLDLSSEQQTQVQAIVDSAKQASSADHQRMRELRQEMKAQAANFDAGRAQQIADEIGLISGRMAYQMTSTRARIYQLLNEEQRAKMDRMRKRHEGRGDKWRGRGRPDSGA